MENERRLTTYTQKMKDSPNQTSNMKPSIIKSHDNDILEYTKDQTTFGAKLDSHIGITIPYIPMIPMRFTPKRKKLVRLRRSWTKICMSDLVEYTKWMSDGKSDGVSDGKRDGVSDGESDEKSDETQKLR